MENEFLTNYTSQTFLDRVRQNLKECDSFLFSVSFIKMAGLSLLIKDIDSALERGCKGRIITSTYQNFTDVGSLSMFLSLQEKYSQFHCHLDHHSFLDSAQYPVGYHCKGYFFTFGDESELIVGSSNITRYALLKNIEWDVVVRGKKEQFVFSSMLNEFQEKWDKTYPLTTKIIKEYTQDIDYAIERWDMDYDLPVESIKPNFMQRKALKELNRYRAMGVDKALVISAMGSGKTYLAAFDVRACNPKRMLYLVHEGSILSKAKETFQHIFGGQVSYGVFTGAAKDIDAQFLFASNITMAKYKEMFSPKAFDYIIVDECHHSTASTYVSILEYFKPEFLLGLTATPERMDNADVLGMFSANVPYELRLREAIMNGLVVPFKYYGVRDQLVSYGASKQEEMKFQTEAVSEENIEFIHEEIEKHRSEGKLKALVFCKNVTHAYAMSEALSKYYSSTCLTGRNTVGERIRVYNELQDDQSPLEILCTVDILNEGVDIPGVNMVVFLRPTESSTIFIQQLGRGLRKYEGKEYVTVLDFIGNSYKRSVQMVLALGSLSENLVMEKRLMHNLVESDFEALGLEKYGVEIHFDPLSKEDILQYIDSENFNRLEYIKQDYLNYKKYIHSDVYPSHMEYWNNECAPDLLRFMSIKVKNAKTCSYYGFLKAIGEENLPVFTERQEKCIAYLSDMLPIVRPYEYKIVQLLLQGAIEKDVLVRTLQDGIYAYLDKVFQHGMQLLLKSTFVKEENNTYFLDAPVDIEFTRYMEDLLEYGLTRYETEYASHQLFNLWAPYKKSQVQVQLLRSPNDTMLGTYYVDGKVIIFAALKKDAKLEERLKYLDKYLSPTLFQWESKNNLSEAEKAKLDTSTEALLFIRKTKDENGIVQPFIYCGTGKMEWIPWTTQQHSPGSRLYHIHMDTALSEELCYDFEVDLKN